MPTALGFALELLAQAPNLINATAKGIEMWKESKSTLDAIVREDRNPTAAEWSALNANVKALRDELHS